MTYITRQDNISTVPLSKRTMNCLLRANVHTVGAMLDCSVDELRRIRNMGEKSINEILYWVDMLLNGSEEYILVESHEGTDPIEPDIVQGPCEEQVVGFIDENGTVASDIPIEKTSLSVRAKNSLIKSGINFVSQVVNISDDELMSIKNLGQKTATEVIEYISGIKVTHSINVNNKHVENSTPSVYQSDIVDEMVAIYGQETSAWMRELLTVKEQHPEATGETLIYRLYENQFVRGTAKAEILKFVEANEGEVSKNSLEEHLPHHLWNTTLTEELLLELEAAMALEVGEIRIRRQYPSISYFVMQIADERARQILEARLNGNTLQEIGEQLGVTRERVRQISLKALRNKPRLREDAFAYIYDNYDFSKEDFQLA